MNSSRRNIFLSLLFTSVVFFSCSKKWDEHNAIDNPLLNEKLLDQISKNPELSKFYEYLGQTGYDSVLALSKTFTVWAPTNQALQNLDPKIIDSKEKLKLFIANHIANNSFLTSQLNQPYIRIKTLNGKNVTFTSTMVDGAVLATKDQYMGNGVLNIINTPILPKVSALEYLMSTSSKQKLEIQSLSYQVRDLTKAEVTGINPTTGAPVYKPGTGIVNFNRFLDQQFKDRANITRKPTDISNEDSTFTYLVLTDNAFESEKTKLSKYYKLLPGLVGLQDSTDSLTKFHIIKDLAFNGLLDKDNFPANIYSAGDSVRFHLDKNAVVETINVSNGVVYVMSSLDYDIANGTYDLYTKLKPILIQGESTNNSTYSAANPVPDLLKTVSGTNVFTKPIRRDTSGVVFPRGSVFTQIMIQNHVTASMWARYRPSVINSTKYKVYWRVVREDIIPLIPAPVVPPVLPPYDLVYAPQRLAFKSPTAITPGFNYIPKPGVLPVLNSSGVQITDADNRLVFKPDYREIFLGEYTLDKFYSITSNLKLSAAAGAASAFPIYLVGNTTIVNVTNTLLLDYIKLVPVP